MMMVLIAKMTMMKIRDSGAREKTGQRNGEGKRPLYITRLLGYDTDDDDDGYHSHHFFNGKRMHWRFMHITVRIMGVDQIR